MGVPSLILGIGPETGGFDLSICPYENPIDIRSNKFIYIFFILLIIFLVSTLTQVSDFY